MNIKGMICFSLCLLLAPSVWATGKVYKCKNAQGSVSYQDIPCSQPNDAVSNWDAKKGNAGKLVLDVGDGGQFFVDAKVNGQSMLFKIDSSASFVTLPYAMGMTAQLTCQDGSSNTGTTGCATTINTLNFGPFTLSGVKAMLSPSASQPVLGINVLRQFNVTPEGSRMTISAK